MRPRRISDVSVNDISKQRTARVDEFLNTRQWNILNLPTNLADLFEFMAACDFDPQRDLNSTFWVFNRYLCLSDLMNLR